MVRDVYAADDALCGADSVHPARGDFRFVVEADADPDVLARVAGPLSIANVAPFGVVLRSSGQRTVIIEIDLRGIPEATAESICRKMTQLTCVLSAEIRRTAAASTDPPARETR